MKRVRVITSVRIAANRPVPRMGDVLDLTDDEYNRFKSLGVFQPLEDAEGASVATNSSEGAEDTEERREDPVSSEQDAPAVVENVPGDKNTQPKKPAKTAPADAWVKYANSLGHDVKGLSKKEVIALVQ